MPITDEQLAQYERDGAVVIDGPLNDDELDRAEAAWDRVKASGKPMYEDPDYLEVIQRPELEEIAKKVLKAGGVHLWWGLNAHERPPSEPPFRSWQENWRSGCHIDLQATWEDFTATPRRIRAELWYWVNDVPEPRGAMRILPGSHRPILEHWGRVLTDEHRAMLPRVHGIRPEPAERYVSYPEHVPELKDTPWLEQEPTAYTAKRGQILVLFSGGLHSAWQNRDRVPRKSITTSWIAEGVKGGLPKNQRDAMMAFHPALRERLRDERKHIVREDFDWVFESDYEPKWAETF